jgi:hypothetical protein
MAQLYPFPNQLGYVEPKRLRGIMGLNFNCHNVAGLVEFNFAIEEADFGAAYSGADFLKLTQHTNALDFAALLPIAAL